MNKSIIKIYDFFIVLSCVFSSLFCYASNTDNNYELVFLFPITFLIIYFTYFFKVLKKSNTPFKIVFFILLYLRYVIMPIGNSLYGYVSTSKYIADKSSYVTASVLIIVELIAVNIIMFLASKKSKEITLKNIEFANKKDFILIVFSIICILIVLMVGGNLINAIYFIVPNEDMSVKYNSLNDIEQTLLLLFDVAKQFIFLIALKKAYQKYSKTNKMIYVLVMVFFALFNILVYTGTNRANFVITTFATVYFLMQAIPKYKKMLCTALVLILIIVLPLLSSYRKSDLISDDFEFKGIMETSNLYFAGIDNVATSVKTAKNFPQYRNFSNFIYDMTRGVIGINQLAKNVNGELSNKLFNYEFFGHWRNTSQIIPIIGQGYFYFDIYGFFIIEVLFLTIALGFEKLFLTNSNIYVKYFTLVILLRLAMMQGLNGTILANRISFEVFIPFVLIFINNKVDLHRGTDYEK